MKWLQDIYSKSYNDEMNKLAEDDSGDKVVKGMTAAGLGIPGGAYAGYKATEKGMAKYRASKAGDMTAKEVAEAAGFDKVKGGYKQTPNMFRDMGKVKPVVSLEDVRKRYAKSGKLGTKLKGGIAGAAIAPLALYQLFKDRSKNDK